MNHLTHDDIADLLHDSLSTDVFEPTADELADFRRLVVDGGPGNVVTLRSRRKRLVVPVIVVGVLSFTGAAAAAAGMDLPGPVRSVARAVGLPVDSPAMVRARRSLDAFHKAVKHGDPTEIRLALRTLQQAGASLSPGELRDLPTELNEAFTLAAPPPGDTTVSSTTSTGAPVQTTSATDQSTSTTDTSPPSTSESTVDPSTTDTTDPSVSTDTTVVVTSQT